MSELPVAYITSLESVIADRDSTIASLREELALAIAHDRQPYPTAEAYERVCATLSTATARIAEQDAIISKLPKTADGVPMVANDHVWIIAPRRRSRLPLSPEGTKQ